MKILDSMTFQCEGPGIDNQGCTNTIGWSAPYNLIDGKLVLARPIPEVLNDPNGDWIWIDEELICNVCQVVLRNQEVLE